MNTVLAPLAPERLLTSTSLPGRTAQLLAQAGILTVADLAAAKLTDIAQYRACGRTKLEELTRFCERSGVKTSDWSRSTLVKLKLAHPYPASELRIVLRTTVPEAVLLDQALPLLAETRACFRDRGIVTLAELQALRQDEVYLQVLERKKTLVQDLETFLSLAGIHLQPPSEKGAWQIYFARLGSRPTLDLDRPLKPLAALFDGPRRAVLGDLVHCHYKSLREVLADYPAGLESKHKYCGSKLRRLGQELYRLGCLREAPSRTAQAEAAAPATDDSAMDRFLRRRLPSTSH